MAIFVLPVIVGYNQRMVEIRVTLGTFHSEDEATATGARLILNKKIVSYGAPTQLMSLKEYNAWLATQRTTEP
jgi:hypothetical protein